MISLVMLSITPFAQKQCADEQVGYQAIIQRPDPERRRGRPEGNQAIHGKKEGPNGRQSGYVTCTVFAHRYSPGTNNTQQQRLSTPK